MIYILTCFKGLILGFLTAAPVGPVALICIHKTLHRGRKSGFISGVGAAIADTSFAVLAAFDLPFATGYITHHHVGLRLVGGMFLVTLGFVMMHRKITLKESHVSAHTLAQDFGSTFLVTLSNPLTVLFFVTVFAVLGLSTVAHNIGLSIALIMGVLMGSLAWWLLLAVVVGKFRGNVTNITLKKFNRITGIIIVVFGLAAFIPALYLLLK